MAVHFDRQYDQVVVPGRSIAQVQPFDDRRASPQQNPVRAWRWRAELLGGDVIDAHEPDPRVGQELRGVWRDVGKVAVKHRRAHPPAPGVSGPKQHALRSSPLMPAELRGIDGRYAVIDLDDARRSHERIEGEAVDRSTID